MGGVLGFLSLRLAPSAGIPPGLEQGLKFPEGCPLARRPGRAGSADMDQVWVNRAVSAEAAVTGRHLRRLWALPGTQLGVVAWPPARRDRWFGGWHYLGQADL